VSSLSLTFRAAAYAERTGEVPVVLVTVTHESLDAPLYFSSDPTSRITTDPLVYGTVSRGNTYTYLPMSLVLPEDSLDTEPAMQLQLDNVMRTLTPLLRSISTPALVTVELVLASTPDVVEATWPQFEISKSTPVADTVSIDLTTDSDATEPYPAGSFTPAGFPGLF